MQYAVFGHGACILVWHIIPLVWYFYVCVTDCVYITILSNVFVGLLSTSNLVYMVNVYCSSV